MSLKYAPMTCSGDTNDFIEKINGNDVNLSVSDYITANPGCSIGNGGVAYYPDLIVPNLDEGDIITFSTSGEVEVNSITGGIHSVQRPR